MRVLQATLPDDCLIFLDAGNCVGWGIHYFSIDPPREIHSSLAMGPMGFAVGAVIGAKIGRPDKTCLALVGDGAFMMHGAEVSTAQAYGVGAIWVVLQDNDLHMVSQGMQYVYPDPDDVWNQLYRLGTPDLIKFAEGLGADAYAVDSPAALQAVMPTVLEKANTQGRPQVIVAAINQQQHRSVLPAESGRPRSSGYQSTESHMAKTTPSRSSTSAPDYDVAIVGGGVSGIYSAGGSSRRSRVRPGICRGRAAGTARSGWRSSRAAIASAGGCSRRGRPASPTRPRARSAGCATSRRRRWCAASSRTS